VKKLYSTETNLALEKGTSAW